MSSCDPQLPDTRSPMHGKGQAFGTVPHTRVLCVGDAASGVWSFLADGVVVPFFLDSGGDPNEGTHLWAADAVVGDDTWRVTFNWRVLDKLTFAIRYTFTAARIGEDESAIYTADQTGFDQVAIPVQLLLTQRAGLPGNPNGITKSEIPEWADPRGIQPKAVCGEPI